VQLIWTSDQTRAAPVRDTGRPSTWMGRSRRGPYLDAAQQLRRWIDDGTLVRDPGPMFYAHSQTYRSPWSGEWDTQLGFLATLRLDPGETMIRCPEEPAAQLVDDRAALLRALRGSLRPVLALYSDPDHTILNRVRGTVADARRTEWTDREGHAHALWPISDPAVISLVMAAMAERMVVVAGDQSDYQAALALQRESQEQVGTDGMPDRLLTYLTEAEDRGTWPAPVYWLLNGLDGAALARLLERLDGQAAVERLADPGMVVTAIGGRATEASRFGLITRDGSYLIGDGPTQGEGDEPTPAPAARPGESLECAAELCERLVVRAGLGWDPAAASESGQLTHASDWRQVLAAVRMGHYAAACLLPPVTIEQLLARASRGNRLPAGSTCIQPRIPTGLVFHLWDEPPG